MWSDIEAVIKRLDLKDDQAFKLGDAIDVKASIALVVITFLATQTASFLTVREPWRELQVVSAFLLAIAGVLALLELWPRTYAIDASESLDGWIAELRDYYQNRADADQLVASAVAAGHIERTKERIEKNNAINEQKSKLMDWSFRCTAVAMLLNLGTLVMKAWS